MVTLICISILFCKHTFMNASSCGREHTSLSTYRVQPIKGALFFFFLFIFFLLKSLAVYEKISCISDLVKQWGFSYLFAFFFITEPFFSPILQNEQDLVPNPSQSLMSFWQWFLHCHKVSYFCTLPPDITESVHNQRQGCKLAQCGRRSAAPELPVPLRKR